MSSEWIDVPVADVRAGDECKVDGFGRNRGNGEAFDFTRQSWHPVYSADSFGIEIPGFDVRRSSIVAVRRRTPEPSPQPGDWRCRVPGTCPECLAACGCISREVYRASGGWSRDTRTGQPWVMQIGDPIVVHVQAEAQNACDALRKAAELAYRGSYASPNQLDDYKRIGLTVTPVDRRGKR